MCEFCLKHGEGRKWYLEAANYSEDLLADVRRRRFIESFATDLEGMTRDTARMEDLDRLPAVFRALVRRWSGRRMRTYHFGQVVPIEAVMMAAIPSHWDGGSCSPSNSNPIRAPMAGSPLVSMP